jgi:hypothetical protein
VTDPEAGAAPEAVDPEPAAICPWCAAPSAAGATRCVACGVALAQRESIGDVQIPGLTSVDPALVDFDKRPLHLRGPSPTQGAASTLIIGAVAGGPIGLAAIGGVAALAAVEFLGTKVGGPEGQALEDLGKPSEVALQALEHLDETKTDPAAAGTAGPARKPEADGDGMSVWRDLPPEADET